MMGTSWRPEHVRVVFCDVDGTLFPSEPIAIEASLDVTNRFVEALGLPVRFEQEELRRATSGKNFRALATLIAAGTEQWGAPAVVLSSDELEKWVDEESQIVSAHLRERLRPDPDVLSVVDLLSTRFEMAAVSASSLVRLQASFEATGLERYFPQGRRFSAEDSLATPVSKPDPAVYLEAIARVGVPQEHVLAIEDSLPGVQSAVAAGCPTIGNLTFVDPADRDRRREDMREAGVIVVVDRWADLPAVLGLPAHAG
jgi:HAD superfamily hydrolase (TIGR01509 family)